MELKEQLRSVWEEVLESSDFTNSDCIMNIGGDSIKIYKISAVGKEKFDLDISPMDVFMYPSIDSLVNIKTNKEPAEQMHQTKILKRRIPRK